MQATRDEILKNLEQLRVTQGEEAYVQARDALAVMLVNQPNGADWLKASFPDIDLDQVRELARKKAAERGAAAPPNDMLALIRTHVPHLQTQAQLDAFMLAFNAFTLTFDSYFAGNAEAGDKAREVVGKALDMAKQIGRMREAVEEILSEQRSAEGAKYVDPPKELTEASEKAKLMAELEAITSRSALNDWYQSERKRIDGVVSKTLRDELFDAIRAKRDLLLN